MDIVRKECGKGDRCLNRLKEVDGMLPISEFYFDKHKKTGYRSECKSCCNKPAILSDSLKSSRNLKIIDEYKKGTLVKAISVAYNVAVTTVYKLLKDNKVEMLDRHDDLTGKIFDRLTVIHGVESKNGKRWLCRCVCGKETKVATSSLKSRHTKSCGCYSAEVASKRLLKHGQTVANNGHETAEYQMLMHAKRRSKEQNISFNLEVSDIVIPEFCPVLGMRLERGKGKLQESSPTLDKRIPELGYVKGNISVISLKANAMKRDGTPEEIRLLGSWTEKQTPSPVPPPYKKLNTERIEIQEWKNMPEFVQNEQVPFAKIIIRVDTQEALDDLSKRLGQDLTPKTKSIWHPKLVKGKDSDKRWVDES